MGITLVQLRDDATQHCRTCPRASRIGNASVTCDGTLIAYANGACPLGLWDHSAPIVHTPREWPILARVIRRLRAPGDRGVGDSLERLIVGGEWFKTAYKSLLGKDCGCNRRKASLNAKFPYDKT